MPVLPSPQTFEHTPNMTLRAVIADDHPITLMGVRAVLKSQSALKIVGEAHSVETLLDLLHQQPCELLVTDLNMPCDDQMDGLRLIQRLRRLYPDMAIVVVTMLDNLTSIRHQAPASNNNWTRTVTVSERSNRGLSREGLTPADVEELFSPGGAQRELADGRTLLWGADGQLAGVTPVSREHGDDDQETYHYAGPGNRLRKVSTRRTSGTLRQEWVTYLPGLEWRESFSDGSSVAKVAVIDAGNMRVIDNPARGEPLVRLSLKDHLGSAGLETDEHGALISQEEYYPYGGTAGYSARSEAEAADKSRRYSGKERDATGLYYYGFRYYQAEFGRWLSADPAGTVDGLNLFRMVKDNPVSYADENGLQSVRLVYGFADVRYKYMANPARKKSPDVLVMIDSLNYALDVTPEGIAKGLMKSIKDGIQVKADHVKKLIEDAPGLEANTAKTLLNEWSAHLKKNYAYVSVSEVIKKSYKKNHDIMSVVHKNNASKELGWSEKDLKPGVFETAYKITKAFENSNKNGAQMAATILLDTREDILIRAVANAFQIAFFRRTSKLGLDWASKSTTISGVDFVMMKCGQYHLEALTDVRPKTGDSMNPKKRYHPITHSEVRYVTRKKLSVNNIQKLG
jgi:insecticidal toxin complex protein TccC